MQRIYLTREARRITYGMLIGDGYMSKHKGKRSQLVLRHSINQLPYLKWKIELLRNNGIKMSEPTIYEQTLKGRDKTYKIAQSQSSFLVDFGHIRDVVYVNGTKKITEAFMNKLDPISIALWIMDDGGIQLSNNNDRAVGIRLSTDSFTLPEQHIIVKYLKKRYGIESRIHKKKDASYIYLPMLSAIKIADIVKDYIHPSMLYKVEAFYTNDDNNKDSKVPDIIAISQVYAKAYKAYFVDNDKNAFEDILDSRQYKNIALPSNLRSRIKCSISHYNNAMMKI